MITNCCPAANALPTIPDEKCAQNFGQIQKIIFQRLFSGIDRNSITEVMGSAGEGDAALLASWTALKAKTDGTKIAVSPFIENPADDGGDARTYGGGNETLNGIEVVIGSNPVAFTCRVNGKKQDIVAELKKLMCESLANNLGVYLVNENGQIEGQVIAENGNTKEWAPIPIQKLFVSDKHHGNYDGPDYNDLSFSFVPGYSDTLDILTLDSSALVL